MKNWLIGAFSIAWILVLFSDYWNKHILHHQAFESFSYPIFLSAWIGITALLIGLLQYSDKAKTVAKRWQAIPLFILTCSCVFLANCSYANIDIDFPLLARVFGKISGYCLALCVIWLAPYSLGNFIRKKVGFKLFSGPSFTIDLTIGLVAYCFILFALALAKLLYLPVIVILIAICIGINFRAFKSWYTTLKAPAFTEKWHWASVLLGSVILLVFSMNFVSDLSPFPSGFDSRNYYMNVAKLVADSHGIIRGYQPYPWQLFLSQGHLLGGGSTLAMLISFTAVFFVCGGFYEILRKILKLSVPISLLGICLFAVTPAVQNHMFVELKVDFGLLIIQAAMLLIILDNVMHNQENATLPNLKHIILLGIITGFGASIKMLNFYLLFAILVTVWTLLFSYKGFLSTFFLSIAAILIAKFDSVSGMNQYHLSIQYVTYGSFLLGLGFLAWIAIQQRSKWMLSVKQTTIYLGIMMMTLSPWIIKNYVETKSLNPDRLIRGANPAPKMNIKTIKQNYNRE